MNRPSNGQALRPAKRPFLSSQGTAPCGINTFCCRIDCLQDLQDLMSSFEPFNKSQQPPGPPRQGTAAPFEAPTSKRQRSTEDFHQIPDLCLRSCEPLCKFIAKAKFPPKKKKIGVLSLHSVWCIFQTQESSPNISGLPEL